MFKWILAVGVAAVLCSLCSSCLRAQTFGIQGQAVVETTVPTTTGGSGGQCGPTAVNIGSAVQPLQSSSYLLGPPLVCSASVEAFDPSEDAIYSAAAASSVPYLGVNNGVLELGISSSGGTLDPNELSFVSGQTSALIFWTDYLVFAGAGLPPDAPVLVQVTIYTQGSISASGSVTYGLNQALYSILDFGTNLPNLGLNCGTATVPAISQPFFYPASTEQSINLNSSYLLCIPAGALVVLNNQLLGEIGGNGTWTGNVNVNRSGVGITVLTPGVTYTSLSKVTYNAPSSVPVSGTACNGVYSGTFAGDVDVSAGQTCTFVSGGITGNLRQRGGNLLLGGATVGGDVEIHGGTFSVGPSVEIGGDLRIHNIPDGTAANQICGATIKGNLHIKSNGTPIQIGSCPGNVVDGNLIVEDNTAATSIYNTTVGGNIVDHNNTAATIINGNTVGGDLRAEDNTVSTQILNNSVTNNLVCQSDTDITGSANTAKHKKGQCSTF
jgi:hypothetical protein